MPGSSSIGTGGKTDDNEAHSPAEGLGSPTLGEKTVGTKAPDDRAAVAADAAEEAEVKPDEDSRPAEPRLGRQ